MNFDNRTLFIADNLDIMRGMDSGTIDLIYLDPPFKSGKQWKAPIGSPAEGIENLQLLCAACNSTKGTGTQTELISRLKAQGVLK